jgi:hypothetical protein
MIKPLFSTNKNREIVENTIIIRLKFDNIHLSKRLKGRIFMETSPLPTPYIQEDTPPQYKDLFLVYNQDTGSDVIFELLDVK